MKRPSILCVDDEPAVLEGLRLNLRRKFSVETATSGALGLAMLDEEKPFAIVLSDMRMPEMNGATFLKRVRTMSPDSVRMLLTGQTDMDSAISAINEGQIFRFLTKPCPPDRLLAAFESAMGQHRLITAERVLLEQTLHGSIKALTDVLALTNPMAFGRASRVKEHVSELLKNIDVVDPWQVEVAAMVSELGCITLPPVTAEKLYSGEALNESEEVMVARLPEVVAQLLGHIPRLESVLEILSHQHDPLKNHGEGATGFVQPGAKILRIATDYETLETRGYSPQLALIEMQKRKGRYNPDILNLFAGLRGASQSENEVLKILVRDVQLGMVFAEDVWMNTGALFVARGYEVTQSFVERAKNFQEGVIKEPVTVLLSSGQNSHVIRT